MTFDLLEEQHTLQDAAVVFARSSLTSDMVQRDREAHFDRDAWRRCAEFGVLGMPIPQDYGGLGLGLLELLAVMEGLGRGTRDQGLLFSLNAHLWTNSIPILLYGLTISAASIFRGCVTARSSARTPPPSPMPDPTSSASARATRDGSHYVLNGSKTFVTNAPVADLFVAYATVNLALGATGITGFIVERNTPGLIVSRKLQKMGLAHEQLEVRGALNDQVANAVRRNDEQSNWRF